MAVAVPVSGFGDRRAGDAERKRSGDDKYLFINIYISLAI
jgi:hypothetical protein